MESPRRARDGQKPDTPGKVHSVGTWSWDLPAAHHEVAVAGAAEAAGAPVPVPPETWIAS